MTDLDLERFVTIQSRHYKEALGELRRGQKTSHWMWFVFPQIAGLGQSPMARLYALASLDEAKAYLAHPVLGPRLVDCVETINAHRGKSAEQIFGAIDAMKLRSSLTLFMRAAPDNPVFGQALDRYFDGRADAATDERL